MFPQSRISRQIKKIQNSHVALAPLPRWSLPLNSLSTDDAHKRLESWFLKKGWMPAAFQKKAWASYLNGQSGLISVPTGHGKTLAAFGGPLIEMMTIDNSVLLQTPLIYIAPLKALARDIFNSIEELLDELELPFRVHLRTGDTLAEERKLFEKYPPQIIITTPESLALMTAQASATKTLAHVRSVIVDEWHELIATKRGSLLQLTLAGVRKRSPKLKVWGVSATLGNLEEAASSLCNTPSPTIITDATFQQRFDVETLLASEVPRSVWFGSMAEKLVTTVVDNIELSQTHLIFTNTRRAAEYWYSAICTLRPEWKAQVALHHGSLAKNERVLVERGLKERNIRLVVATSSLELGVDFPQIQNIYQVGSVKSLGRALQRAGRGLHQPGLPKYLKIIPVTLFDALEPLAIEQAHINKHVESRHPLDAPLDVVLQHILNSAFNEGFDPDELLAEIRSAWSFRNLSRETFEWALDFLSTGGVSLKAYAKYQKLKMEKGRYIFSDTKIARDHRLNIGTIVGDLGVSVKFLKGNTIGQISESFAAKLKKGDVFLFAGRELEFVQLRDAAIYVKIAQSKAKSTASWSGNTLSISSTLMSYIRDEIEKPIMVADEPTGKDMSLRQLLLREQDRMSHKPHTGEFLIERYQSREGHHLFIYPWAGRDLHEGLGHLFAYRLAKEYPNTISVAANDYGIELLGAEPFPPYEDLREYILSADTLEDDIAHSLNFKELVRRQFREIARVSGLIIANSARNERTVRHLQMSSGLLFDVFEKYDPSNLLLQQAHHEVLKYRLQLDAIRRILEEHKSKQCVEQTLHHLSPFALTLYLERTKSRVSTETLEQRVARFQRKIFEVAP